MKNLPRTNPRHRRWSPKSESLLEYAKIAFRLYLACHYYTRLTICCALVMHVVFNNIAFPLPAHLSSTDGVRISIGRKKNPQRTHFRESHIRFHSDQPPDQKSIVECFAFHVNDLPIARAWRWSWRWRRWLSLSSSVLLIWVPPGDGGVCGFTAC